MTGNKLVTMTKIDNDYYAEYYFNYLELQESILNRAFRIFMFEMQTLQNLNCCKQKVLYGHTISFNYYVNVTSNRVKSTSNKHYINTRNSGISSASSLESPLVSTEDSLRALKRGNILK